MRTENQTGGWVTSGPPERYRKECSACDATADLRQISMTKATDVKLIGGVSVVLCPACRLDLIHHLSARD